MINKNIIDLKDQDCLKEFLSRYQISYRLIEEDSAADIDQYRRNGVVAVVDYTYFDKLKDGDSAIPLSLDKKNVAMIRFDWSKSSHFYPYVPEMYPPLKRAGRLVIQNTLRGVDVAKTLDSELMRAIPAGVSNLKERKKIYINALKDKLPRLDEQTKDAFAVYLMSAKDHLLKRERHFFRLQQYSIQTRSMHEVVSMLLGKKYEVTDHQVLINNYAFKRHVKS